MTDERQAALVALPARVVVGANGAYWRDYGTHYSMCPVSEDNDPVEVVAVYVRAATLDVERLARAFAVVHETDPAFIQGRATHTREQAAEHWHDWELDAEAIAREYRDGGAA